MKVCGIVTEYNPFHNGHIYHIQQAKQLSQCDVLIAVMSGNFVQRGEPAILDKFTRAQYAIKNGVDIVLELPYIYSTQCATKFAHGAINILKQAQVTSICFGSESNNIEELKEIAETCINPDNLKEAMATGLSFPKAYGLLSSTMEPNDILAVAYLKELLGSNIQPISIQRTVHYYDTSVQTIASATAIRQAALNHDPLRNSTPMEKELTEDRIVTLDSFYPYIRTLLLTLSPSYLSELFLFSEGIENHLIKNAKECDTFHSFMNHSVTPRYTSARIKRTLLQLLVQVTKKEVEELPENIPLRVLAFNQNGQRYLKYLKDKEIPVISRFGALPKAYQNLELRSTLLYTSQMKEEQREQICSNEIGGAIRIV